MPRGILSKIPFHKNGQVYVPTFAAISGVSGTPIDQGSWWGHLGSMVICQVYVQFTANGTGSNRFTCSLPTVLEGTVTPETISGICVGNNDSKLTGRIFGDASTKHASIYFVNGVAATNKLRCFFTYLQD